MNTVDVLLERFDLESANDLIEENMDPYNYFSSEDDGYAFIEQVYLEAQGTKKKNIFQKLIETIKKIWRWICNQFRKFLNWIKAKFKGKKKTKSADQIAGEIFGPVAVAGAGGVGAAAVAGQKKVPKRIAPVATDAKAKDGGNVIRITVPSDPKSEMHVDGVIELAYKDLMLQLDGDRNSVRVNLLNPRSGSIPMQGSPWSADPQNVIRHCKHMNLQQQLLNCANIIADETKSATDLQTAIDHYNASLPKAVVLPTDEVTLDQLIQTDRWMAEILKKIDGINSLENNPRFNDNAFITALNEFVSIITKMQFSINKLTGYIRESYKIDARYLGAAKTIEDLDRFVDNCITAGIPPKFVSYNAYLVAGDQLMGSGSQANEKNPRWGQTRLVMYPANPVNGSSVVCKVAINENGRRTNMAEISVVDKFKEVGKSELLPHIEGTTTKKTVILWEELDTIENRRISNDDIQKLAQQIQEVLEKEKIPLDILTDIHDENVGYRGNQLVYLDFAGFARRRQV